MSAAELCRGTTGNTRNYCDPTKESCWDVRMFNFAGERYFTDMVRQCAASSQGGPQVPEPTAALPALLAPLDALNSAGCAQR